MNQWRSGNSRNITNNGQLLLSLPDGITLPFLVHAAGEPAARRYLEFFAAQLRNAGTRQAYCHAVNRFYNWCDEHGLAFEQIEPLVVATYIEQLTHELSSPTVKLHLAAIRMLYDWLVTGQIVPFNPAASVRGPKYVVRKGKTPVLSSEEARQLIDAIDTSTIIGLRDRALSTPAQRMNLIPCQHRSHFAAHPAK